MLWRRSARMFWMGGNRVGLSGGFCVMLALMLLLVPLQWLLAGIFAAAFHELCHYAAIRALSAGCGRVRLNSFAAQLPLPEMSRGREALCALAGPLGSLCLLPLAHIFPRVSVCAAMQLAYNLLPIYPLDGGRALQCGLSLLLPPPVTAKLCVLTALTCKAAVLAVGIYGCFWLKLGVFPLLLALLLLIRVK